MAKLHDYYKDEVVETLMKKFGYHSVMQVPRVEKITLNMGVGEAIADKKLLDNAANDLAAISGQKHETHVHTKQARHAQQRPLNGASTVFCYSNDTTLV